MNLGTARSYFDCGLITQWLYNLPLWYYFVAQPVTLCSQTQQAVTLMHVLFDVALLLALQQVGT